MLNTILKFFKKPESKNSCFVCRRAIKDSDNRISFFCETCGFSGRAQLMTVPLKPKDVPSFLFISNG